MTSSPERPRAAARDDLPPALSSMWRLCKLGYRHEPGLLLAAFFLALLAALPDALLALWLKLFGEGVLGVDLECARDVAELQVEVDEHDLTGKVHREAVGDVRSEEAALRAAVEAAAFKLQAVESLALHQRDHGVSELDLVAGAA